MRDARVVFSFGLLAVLAIVALITLAAGPLSPSVAQTPRANGKIAFDSSGAGGFSVVVISGDGSARTNLTPDLTFARFPDWSPDGTRIAFASRFGISVMNADGSALTDLIAGGSAPEWSPDGSQILFWSGPDMYVMDADGTNVTQIFDDIATISGLAWAPDGVRIAFMRPSGGEFDVYLTDVNGSEPVQLTTTPGWDGDPDWSPDGSKIAFSSVRDGYLAIYVMNADGSDQRPLIPVHRCEASPTPAPVPPETPRQCPGDQTPAWSPDGTKVVFSGYPQGGNSEIYVANADGSDIQQLTDTPNTFETFPDWQPLPAAEPLASSPSPVPTAIPPSPSLTATPEFDACAEPSPIAASPVMTGLPPTPSPAATDAPATTASPSDSPGTEAPTDAATVTPVPPATAPDATDVATVAPPSTEPKRPESPTPEAECDLDESAPIGTTAQAIALAVVGVLAAGSAIALPAAGLRRLRRKR